VSVLISPFDTSSTAMLIIYSVQVGTLGDSSLKLVRMKDAVRSFREALTRAPLRCLPVADDSGRVVGVISDADLLKEPNIEIIMVDHNEPSQAIEGIENYRIIEIIDHHRLGNLSTRHPITFINRVVGATCTIVANLYREQKVPIEKGMASILLCGIIADTLALRSDTTTETDVETAEYLSSITGLDIGSLDEDLRSTTSQTSMLPVGELLGMDVKDYSEKGGTFTISQVETYKPKSITVRRDEIMAAMERKRAEKDHLFVALLVTDVTLLDSHLFIVGNPAFISQLNFPHEDDGIFELAGIVSRKKQLVPLLSELVARYGELNS